jgi:hypothetical protein
VRPYRKHGLAGTGSNRLICPRLLPEDEQGALRVHSAAKPNRRSTLQQHLAGVDDIRLKRVLAAAIAIEQPRRCSLGDVAPDLPDGQISSSSDFRLSSPFAENIPLGVLVDTGIQRNHPVPNKRGVSRSSRTLGAGCDGRGRRCETSSAGADGKVVWSRRLDAGVESAGIPAEDGDKQARSPGRARRKPLKPFACGNAG